jgi:hypothetical protein
VTSAPEIVVVPLMRLSTLTGDGPPRFDPGKGAFDGGPRGPTIEQLLDGLATHSEPLPQLHGGMRVDEFEVRHLIARGGLGLVYAARDVRLGRLVALKVIRPDRMRPDRLRRFVDEARITASFNHPNIVVVYGLGAVGGNLYIALEHLDGEPLDARIARGRLGEREALRIGRDIARALDEAHRHGVIHRDVKPSNVIIPTDGRTRVLDFGLAVRVLDTGDGVVAGTPAYLAPELWRGGEAAAASDVFSFGLVIAEMLLGAHPYDSCGTGDVPSRARTVASSLAITGIHASTVELVRSCLAREPDARPSLSAIIAALDGAIDGPGAGPVGADVDTSPFRALMSFREHDAAHFVGREGEIGAFLETCRTRPVVAIVGPAGAGKSSFVLAGLVPRLAERGETTVIVVRPGASPFEALAAALLNPAASDATPAARPTRKRATRAGVESLATTLSGAVWELNLALHDLAMETGGRVVLVVDQLEEVLTQGVPKEVIAAFVESLAAAAVERDGPVLVILAARDDFIGRVGMSAGMSRVLEHVLVLSPPRPDQLRSILTVPLARKGYTWDDPTVVDDMMAAVQGSSAALPLVQFVCQALWDRRDPARRVLLRSAYDALGGVGGALSNYADEVLGGLGAAQLEACKQVCLRLVSPDDTRLSVPEGRLTSGLPPEADAVVRSLVAARLLTVRRDPGDGGALVELSHDSLVDTWGTLRRWRREHDHDLTQLADIEDAAALWERRGRRPEDTWSGDALRDALRGIARSPIQPTPLAREFLAVGDQRSRRTRRLRTTLFVTTALVLLGLAVGGVALAARFRAQAERIDLARADIGRFVLQLEPFDWDPVALAPRPVAPGSLPLRVRVHTVIRRGPTTAEDVPGREVDPALITIDAVEGTPGALRIATRAGPAFLAIEGRGGDCGPSWIQATSLPGYADRDTRVFTVPVPTCQASRAGAVRVDAGPAIIAGPGEPAPRLVSMIQPERTEVLAAFLIDRTEVPNALAAQWFAASALTGASPTEYPAFAPFQQAGDGDRPVSNLDAHQASALCRYLGRRLPSSDEWEKAARGGVTLNGAPNPHPSRNFPWGTARDSARANLRGEADGFRGVAPVGTFPNGASPYGVLDLVGNVEEWTSTPKDPARLAGLRVIRGGDWDSDPAEDYHFLAYENQRLPRFFSFGLGVRCVQDVE